MYHIPKCNIKIILISFPDEEGMNKKKMYTMSIKKHSLIHAVAKCSSYDLKWLFLSKRIANY